MRENGFAKDKIKFGVSEGIGSQERSRGGR